MENFENNYLRRKIEPKKTVVEKIRSERAAEFFDKKFFIYEWEKRGIIEFEKGETRFSLVYTTPNFLELFKISLKQDVLTVDGINLLQKVFKQVSKLEMQNKSGRFNLFEHLPEGYRVFFNPHSYRGGESRVDVNEKIIFLKADPLTRNGLLALMHEVGHTEVIKANEESPSYGEINTYSKVVSDRRGVLQGKADKDSHYNMESVGKIVLKDERDAWSSALRNLREFMDDLEIDTNYAESIIHGVCLQSYSDVIRDMVAKNHVGVE